MLLQPSPHGLGMVKSSVVADQSDLPSGVGRDEGDQEREEVGAALAVSHGVGDPAGGEVDTAIDHRFFVLPRGGYLRLRSDRGLHSGERRMPMNLDLVLIDQGFGSVFLSGVFFRRASCRRAFS